MSLDWNRKLKKPSKHGENMLCARKMEAQVGPQKITPVFQQHYLQFH